MTKFSIGASAAVDVPPVRDISYTDSCETFLSQPGIGWGRYYWISATLDGTTGAYTEHPTGLSTPMFDISAFSSGNDYRQDHYRAVADNKARVGGSNVPINEQTLEAIGQTFKTAREKGVLCIPRFAYARDAYVGTEPDDVNWIIRHIQQLSAVVNEYKDIIIAIEAGMIGPWGEMHGSKYIAPEYSNKIIGAMLENYDSSIPILCRNPGLIINYAGSRGAGILESLPLAPDHPAYRLGMYNDGYLGTDTDYGTWIDMTREEGVRFLASQNGRMPYGGEMAHTKVEFLKDHKSPIYEQGFIKELYESRLSYLRNILTNTTGLQKVFEGTEFTHSTDFEGMPNVSEYYGKTWQKFILDHMGYRPVLSYSCISERAFEGYIENTGFGSYPQRLNCELILKGAAGVIDVLPLDLDLNDGHYSFTLEGGQSGEYKVYLRFSAVPFERRGPDTVSLCFANPGVFEKELGANYIGTMII